MSITTVKEWKNVIAYFGVDSMTDNYRVCVLDSPLTGDGLSLLPPQTELSVFSSQGLFDAGKIHAVVEGYRSGSNTLLSSR